MSTPIRLNAALVGKFVLALTLASFTTACGNGKDTSGIMAAFGGGKTSVSQKDKKTRWADNNFNEKTAKYDAKTGTFKDDQGHTDAEICTGDAMKPNSNDTYDSGMDGKKPTKADNRQWSKNANGASCIDISAGVGEK